MGSFTPMNQPDEVFKASREADNTAIREVHTTGDFYRFTRKKLNLRGASSDAADTLNLAELYHFATESEFHQNLRAKNPSVRMRLKACSIMRRSIPSDAPIRRTRKQSHSIVRCQILYSE